MCKTMEVLGVYVHCAATNLLIVVVYRSGFDAVNALFFDEFADLIERVAAFAAPIVIVGDINLHLDDPSAPTTASFNDILGGADFPQHVTGATHRAGHTLDVLITQSDAIVTVTVVSLELFQITRSSSPILYLNSRFCLLALPSSGASG